jgi:uncharacterized protein (DUF433 family)
MATTTATSTYPHIRKNPESYGGKAVIDRTGVRVNNVVSIVVKEGGSIDDVREAYPDLALAQIHAALAYYYDHPEEIDAELDANARIPEMIERGRAEYFKNHPDR